MSRAEQNAAFDAKNLRYLWIASFLFVAIHFLTIRLTTHGYISGFMVVALGLLRISCCLWWFARLSSSSARYRWLLYAVGAILGNTSTQIYVWRSLFPGEHSYLSGAASLFTSLACIPFLLSIASNFSSRDPKTVRKIDLALSLTLGYLFVVQILSPVGAGGASTEANILFINRMIDFEDAFLLICAMLQFLASETIEDRRYLYVYFCCMSVSVPLLAVRNRWVSRYPIDIWDLVVDVPPLVFLLLALNPIPAVVRNLRPPERIVHLARGGSPLFMSLALTLLGISVSRSHFYLGSAGILLGITGYGLRNAIIHGKLLQTEDNLLVAKNELEVQVSRDGLTGIPNRRLFDETLRREWRAAVHAESSLAVLMIDIDFFKDVNDLYGHQKGDECLIAVAKAIHDMLPRAGDFVARYGGEEFGVILPKTSIAGAFRVAERPRSGVVQLAIAHMKSPHDYVTVSIGVAVGDIGSVPNPNLLLKVADEALYRAKRSGRNRVEMTDMTAVGNAGDLSANTES